MVHPQQGSCRVSARAFACALARDESGQILPLLAVVMVLLIGAGALVMWLGFSTVIVSKAQTAADAAALAGEQELVDEMQSIRYGAGGQVLAPSYSPTQVCNQAEKYAADNDGYMSCPRDIQFIPSSSGLFGTDVEVTVQSQQTLPGGAVDAGHGATAMARASTDPFSQASPQLNTTTTSCDASVIAGSTYDPPTNGTGPGFFSGPNTDFTQGCEPKLAGKLEALAKAKGLHLVGTRGYDTSASATDTSASATGTGGATVDTGGPDSATGAGGIGSALGTGATALGTGGAGTGTSGAGGGSTVTDQINTAHSCGAASTTDGFPKPGAPRQITDATLKSFGLTRPFPGDPDEIELIGSTGCIQEVSPTAGASQTVGFGNSDVHLVPLSGGPVGSFATLGLGGPIEISAQGMALGCQIWKIGQQWKVNQTVMESAFLAAWDESTMQNYTTYDGQEYSLGMFQQQAPDGWGTAAEDIIPADEIKMYFGGTGRNTQFYDGANGDAGAMQDYTPGILPWVLAQDVQGSKPGEYTGGANYKAQLPEATTMIDEIEAGSCNSH